ncbi:hypothetical protein CFS9_04220 [Flavobacterium sp. CFS9]|uniref:Bacteriocin-type signal sequence-containing protein n=1 Tax=Flavobacterium sp. CFS9 TaxID=3143118 RepID=A0AAT9GX23_9FLAO
MDLKKLRLEELNTQELLSIEAGSNGWGKWVLGQVIDHWDEIKKGFREGWEAASH